MTGPSYLAHDAPINYKKVELSTTIYVTLTLYKSRQARLILASRIPHQHTWYLYANNNVQLLFSISVPLFRIEMCLSDGFSLSHNTEICINKVYKARITHYLALRSVSYLGQSASPSFLSWTANYAVRKIMN